MLLSSPSTFVWKYFVPSLLFVFIAALLVHPLDENTPAYSEVGGRALLLLVGLALVRAGLRLKTIIAEREGLVVKHFRQIILVPYSHVSDVKQYAFMGYTRIVLKEPCVFGKVLSYIPPFRLFGLYSLRLHPNNRLLRERCDLD